MFAIGKGMSEIVQKLLEIGADIHLKNIDGLTALQIAVGIERLDMVDLLIDAGGDIARICNEYPRAKETYKKLVTNDLLKSLNTECGISGDDEKLVETTDYFLKHGLTKFYEVGLLEDDEIEKIPIIEKFKTSFASCIDRFRQARRNGDNHHLIEQSAQDEL